MEEIKNNPYVYTTKEGIQEIKSNPQVYTTQEGMQGTWRDTTYCSHRGIDETIRSLQKHSVWF